MIQMSNLQSYRKEIDDGLAGLVRRKIVPRIFAKDGTVWTAGRRLIRLDLGRDAEAGFRTVLSLIG